MKYKATTDAPTPFWQVVNRLQDMRLKLPKNIRSENVLLRVTFTHGAWREFLRTLPIEWAPEVVPPDGRRGTLMGAPVMAISDQEEPVVFWRGYK